MLAAASAILISLLATAAYYVITVLVAIGAQKYFLHDKPNEGFLFKLIDFPLLLPEVLFEKMVHPKAVPYFYDRKDGYMRRQVVYFVLNVILYAVPIYFLLMRD